MSRSEDYLPAGLTGTQRDAAPTDEFRSGFVTLVGRPNAGKSTLVNAVVGKKVAITSKLPQTTRRRLQAVVNADDTQMILVDTPGLHKPQDALGSELNRAALTSLADVDLIVMLIDSSQPVGKGDAWVARQLQATKTPKILVLSKSDLASDEQIAEQRERACELLDFDDVIVLSAVEDEGLDRFLEVAARFLPPGPRWFPQDMSSDQPIEILIAEYIREKILRTMRDEVPYAVGVEVEEYSYSRKRDLAGIRAVIYVERDSQKGIIIGKGGSMIKLIGTQARMDLERLLGTRVHLDLRVKVRKNWRRDINQIRRFGYGDEV